MAAKKKRAKKKATKKKAAKKKAALKRSVWDDLAAGEDVDLTRENPLLGMLFRHAWRQGMSISQLAKSLGVTPGYISQMRSGHRLIKHISDEFADRAAEFLGVPRSVVLLAAGRVREEDFLPADEPVEHQIDLGIETLLRDPRYAPLAPPRVAEFDYETKLLILRLYEDASGKSFLGKRITADEAAELIKRLSSD